MANTKSAEKRYRQAERRRERKRSQTSEMRTQIKKMRKTIEEGEADKIKATLSETFSIIDTAAKRNVIHDNTASRYKARLAKAAKTQAG